MPHEHARENIDDAIDAFVTAQMNSQHIPGLSLVVIRGGVVVLARGYGFANLELSVRAAPETVFQIGSITKQFTAAAVMMLAEEGKISLDAPISRYQDGLPAAWGGVTVRHLLGHTSGIKSFTSIPDVMARLTFLPTSRDEVLALVAGEPLEFAPGGQYAYNNTGYYLLGHIIERVSGQPYADFLRERIFKPLTMAATHVNDLKDIVPNRASGYQWAEDRWRNADHISMTWPFSAGALISTALDLAKWDAALGSETLIPKAAWQQMWTPGTLTDGTKTGYGFGWNVSDYHGHPSIEHGGGIPGFNTFAERFPEDDVTVIALANVAPSTPWEIARGVAGHYIPDLQPARSMTPEPDPDPQWTAALGGVLEAVTQGRDSPYLAAGYRAKLAQSSSAGRASEVAEFSFIAERNLRGSKIERNGAAAASLRFIKIAAEGSARYGVFYLTTDGKVADIEVE